MSLFTFSIHVFLGIVLSWHPVVNEKQKLAEKNFRDKFCYKLIIQDPNYISVGCKNFSDLDSLFAWPRELINLASLYQSNELESWDSIYNSIKGNHSFQYDNYRLKPMRIKLPDNVKPIYRSLRRKFLNNPDNWPSERNQLVELSKKLEKELGIHKKPFIGYAFHVKMSIGYNGEFLTKDNYVAFVSFNENLEIVNISANDELLGGILKVI